MKRGSIRPHLVCTGAIASYLYRIIQSSVLFILLRNINTNSLDLDKSTELFRGNEQPRFEAGFSGKFFWCEEEKRPEGYSGYRPMTPMGDIDEKISRRATVTVPEVSTHTFLLREQQTSWGWAFLLRRQGKF